MVALGWEKLEYKHPREPHFYLAVLGTEPAAQGRGLGSSVLSGVLDQCDRDGVPAVLVVHATPEVDLAREELGLGPDLVGGVGGNL